MSDLSKFFNYLGKAIIGFFNSVLSGMDARQIESLVLLLLIFMGALTVLLIFSETIRRSVMEGKFDRAITEYEIKRSVKLHLKLNMHLESILFSYVDSTAVQTVITIIYTLTIVLFIIPLILFYNMLLPLKLTLSVLLSCLPYLTIILLRLRVKLKASNEGIPLITELVAQYRINYKNMAEALDKSIERNTEIVYLKPVLNVLSIRLRNYASEDQLVLCLDEFMRSTGTVWARNLAYIIKMSMDMNTMYDVEPSLISLLHALKQAKQIELKNRENNVDTKLIAYFGAPFIYIFLMISTVFMLGSFEKFQKYQFENSISSLVFVATIIVWLVNIILMYLYKNTKFDI